MSEQIDDIFSPEHHYLSALSAELRAAFFQPYLDEHAKILRWSAQDGESVYVAYPAIDPDTNYPWLREFAGRMTPLQAYFSLTDTWLVSKVSQPDMNGESTLKHYSIGFGQRGLRLEVSTHDGLQLFGDDLDQWQEQHDKSLDLQYQLGLTAPEDQDYAELENAVNDLKKQLADTNHDRTFFDIIHNDEAKWRRRFDIDPFGTVQLELPAEFPKGAWFAVSIGGIALGVKATDVFDVQDKIDAFYDDKIPASFVSIYEDDIQETLNQRYVDKDVVEFIAYSLVEFPADDDELTEDQKAAFSYIEELHGPQSPDTEA